MKLRGKLTIAYVLAAIWLIAVGILWSMSVLAFSEPDIFQSFSRSEAKAMIAGVGIPAVVSGVGCLLCGFAMVLGRPRGPKKRFLLVSFLLSIGVMKCLCNLAVLVAAVAIKTPTFFDHNIGALVFGVWLFLPADFVVTGVLLEPTQLSETQSFLTAIRSSKKSYLLTACFFMVGTLAGASVIAVVTPQPINFQVVPYVTMIEVSDFNKQVTEAGHRIEWVARVDSNGDGRAYLRTRFLNKDRFEVAAKEGFFDIHTGNNQISGFVLISSDDFQSVEVVEVESTFPK